MGKVYHAFKDVITAVMPIEEKDVGFRSGEKRAELEERVAEMHSLLERASSHNQWYDRVFWDRMVRKLITLEMFEDDLDDMITSDPHADIQHLERMLGTTANRIKDLRGRLGIDASKMRMLRPKEVQKKSLLEAIEDAGFEGA